MPGSFKNMFAKFQRYLFGEGSEDTDIEVPIFTTETASTRERKPRMSSSENSRVKMVHHYPKQEKQHTHKGQKIQIKRRTGPKKNSASEQSRLSEHNSREGVLYKKEESSQMDDSGLMENQKQQLEKKAFFQGNNFEANEIPSPVFGFNKYSLRPESIRKTNEMILKDPEEHSDVPLTEGYEKQERIDDLYAESEEEDHSLRSEENIPERPDTINEELLEEQTFQADHYRNGKQDFGEEQNEKTDSESRPANEEKLNRRERRRQEAELKKREKKTTSPFKKNNVPFNVLMYPDNTKKQEKKDISGRTTSKGYQFPTLSLLNIPPRMEDNDDDDLHEQREQLEATLHNFSVKAKVVKVTKGPAVTRFEVQPEAGVKVNKITNLTDDIKLALAAKDLRMEAPIPGKSAIGIEVPNLSSKPVFLREILRRDVFTRSASPLTVAMGLDISGNPVVSDLQKMPHGLIAGATGSGKSVCINSILLSLLYKATPDEVKLMLIDPKMVELASYKEIPHLVTPVINDAKEATAGLKWAVEEMEDRYQKLAHEGVRDIKKYNERMAEKQRFSLKMPYIVIVIDELADLMMVAPQDVEDAVCRIAQKARACGIHLLLATQRPSVDVITGLIKANIPSRTAFAVSSQADSRTILDIGGAERLIGKGDMLFYENGSSKPIRVQGTFVSDEEIESVTDFAKRQQQPSYLFDQEDLKKKADHQENTDELFEEACQFVAEQGSASSSLLQRKFSIGYNRAAKLIDAMEARGIISEAMGSKPRRVLMTSREIEENLTI